MRFRKTIAFMGALAILAASCTGFTSTKTKAAVKSTLSGSITVWEHNNSFEPSLKAVVKEFNKHYPNVTVNYEVKNSDTYYSLLSTAIQSGEAPDLFWTNGTATSNMGDMVNNHALLNLTKVVNYSSLASKSLKLAKVGNSMYSVPWMTFDTRCVYYNKTLFKKHKWNVPKKFSDFEKLLAAEKKAGYIPISFSPNDSWCILFAFEPLLSAYSPSYTKGLANYSVKATAKPVADTLSLMLKWAKKGYFGSNYLGVMDDTAQTLTFTTGKAVMDIAGSWDATTIAKNNPKLKFGAFQIPSKTGQTGMVGTYANGFSVYQKTQNLAASEAFIKFCATLKAQTLWVQALGAVSGSPKIKASSEIAKEISKCDATYTSWQSVLANYVKPGKNATTIWENYVPKLFSGKYTVKKLMSSIAKTMK